MSARISKISLIVFVVLLVLSGFLLSVAGEYWPWYAVMAVFAVVPLVVGPRYYRLLGAVALVLSVILIVSDYAAGKRFRERHHHISVEKTVPPIQK
jgi:purine-cytosine permease-like protein